MTSPIRVVLAEDQKLLRSSLARILARDAGLELVGTADGMEPLVALVREHRPDIALVDLWMPEGVPSGFDAPRTLRRIEPSVRVLALSSSVRASDVRRAFDAGFDGYSTKEVTAQILAERIQLVVAGKRFIDPEIAHVVLGEAHAELTVTELRLLQSLALGHSQVDAARDASLSDRQVRRVLRSALRKLGAGSVTQAVALAAARGLVNV